MKQQKKRPRLSRDGAQKWKNTLHSLAQTPHEGILCAIVLALFVGLPALISFIKTGGLS